MSRSSRHLAALFAGALVTICCATAGVTQVRTAAAAAAPSPTRLHPVAGSSRYLVYEERRKGDPSAGGLFVLSKDGHTRRLATLADAGGSYSITGSMLVYLRPYASDPTHLSWTVWFNLKTGAHGKAKEPPPVYIAGDGWVHRSTVKVAAPDGWVTMTMPPDTPGPVTFDDQPTSGPATSLGQPFDDQSIPQVISGGDNLVVYSVATDFSDVGTGELRVMSFRHPGVYRTLVRHVRAAEDENYWCMTMNANYVGCETPGHSGKDHMSVLPLDGSHAVKTTEGCPDFFNAVMHRAVVWPGCDGRLTVLSPDGKVSVSKHAYDAIMVPAFGEVVVATESHRRLELVSSATGKPKVLVQTTEVK